MRRNLFWGLLLMLACGCSPSTRDDARPTVAPDKPTVAATSYPLAYFAERLAGDAAQVQFPVPDGVDPAYWEPTDADITRVQQANLILLNGAGYERWLTTATLPEQRLVDTSSGFASQYLKLTNVVTHSHGPEGAHTHGGTDFNTWLDPRQALQQATAVREALIRLLPADRSGVELRFHVLASELVALDQQLDAASTRWRERPLLASHPVYGYLARRYQWKLESVHWEPNEQPPEEEWAKLTALLKKHAATEMIWEDEPLADVAARLKSLGVACVVFRPCGQRPPAGDYLTEMKANAERLREVSGGMRGDGTARAVAAVRSK